MIHSFRGRVVTTVVAVTLLTLGAYVALVFFLFRAQLKSDLNQRLISYERSVESSLRTGGSIPDPPLGGDQIGAVILNASGAVEAATRTFEPELEGNRGSTPNAKATSGAPDDSSGERNGDGKEVGTDTDHAPLSLLRAAATHVGAFVNVPGQEGTDLRAWVRSVTIDGSAHTVAALAPSSASGSPASRLLTVAVVGLAIAVGLVALVAWWSGDLAVRPLGQLSRQVHDLDEQNLEQRVDVPRAPTEVADVARALNTLLSRIDASLAREKQFLANASHELRSPLAVLRGELELALNDGDPGRIHAGLRSAITETDRLARLTDDLLLLARTEAGFAPKLESTPLADVAATAVARASTTARERGVKLILEGDNVNVLAQAMLAERAVANLIENALDQAPAGSNVTIELWANPSAAGVDVVDSGPGVIPGERAGIFERFARAGTDRSSRRGGFGLGLAIVKSIMTAAGGSAELVSADPGSTRFRLTFIRSA
jgi:signal transduction histidine kinase